MKSIPTTHPEVLLFEPSVFQDERGFLFESFNHDVLAGLGLKADFVQDNHSFSRKNVLRGLHYQLRSPQGKLVRVVTGEVFDVAVDLRRESPRFGQWVAANLSAVNKRLQWIPRGFAHGYLVLSEGADVLYKTTGFYVAKDQHTIRWDDPDLGIAWPLGTGSPIVSARDLQGASFREAAT